MSGPGTKRFRLEQINHLSANTELGSYGRMFHSVVLHKTDGSRRTLVHCKDELHAQAVCERLTYLVQGAHQTHTSSPHEQLAGAQHVSNVLVTHEMGRPKLEIRYDYESLRVATVLGGVFLICLCLFTVFFVADLTLAIIEVFGGTTTAAFAIATFGYRGWYRTELEFGEDNTSRSPNEHGSATSRPCTRDMLPSYALKNRTLPTHFLHHDAPQPHAAMPAMPHQPITTQSPLRRLSEAAHIIRLNNEAETSQLFQERLRRHTIPIRPSASSASEP